MKKLWCFLWGHKAVFNGVHAECERCGNYEPPFAYDEEGWTRRQRLGILKPIREAWYAVRNFKSGKCSQCGKIVWFPRVDRDSFCSRKCQDEWVPF